MKSHLSLGNILKAIIIIIKRHSRLLAGGSPTRSGSGGLSRRNNHLGNENVGLQIPFLDILDSVTVAAPFGHVGRVVRKDNDMRLSERLHFGHVLARKDDSILEFLNQSIVNELNVAGRLRARNIKENDLLTSVSESGVPQASPSKVKRGLPIQLVGSEPAGKFGLTGTTLGIVNPVNSPSVHGPHQNVQQVLLPASPASRSRVNVRRSGNLLELLQSLVELGVDRGVLHGHLAQGTLAEDQVTRFLELVALALAELSKLAKLVRTNWRDEVSLVSTFLGAVKK